MVCDRACLLNDGSLFYVGKSGDALDRYHALLNGAALEHERVEYVGEGRALAPDAGGG